MWFNTYPQTLIKVVVTNAFCVVSHTLHADIGTVRLTYVATTLFIVLVLLLLWICQVYLTQLITSFLLNACKCDISVTDFDVLSSVIANKYQQVMIANCFC